jgi:hypothetical protein
MTKRGILLGALIVAAVAFSIGASIFTRDWAICTSHHGGKDCREPRDRAVIAWVALASNAISLVTNILDDNP